MISDDGQPQHGNVSEDALIDGLSKVDPLFSAHQDFDYDAVEVALGCAPEQLDDDSCSRLATALIVMLRWIIGGQKLQPGCENLIGTRAVAAAWVLKPDLFDSVSQAELGRQLGKTHQVGISKHAAEFTRLFNVRNRGQSHAWNATIDPRTSTKPLTQEEPHEV